MPFKSPLSGDSMLSLENCDIVLATHNEGKLREFRDLLKEFGANAVSAAKLGLEAPDETGEDFESNALIKALHASEMSGWPALADDSGLCIDALDGKPGVRSADWAEGPGGRDFERAMRLVHGRLREANAKEPVTARFVSVLCLAWPDGSKEFFRGTAEGRITWPGRGSFGFGYDPIFVPSGETRTFGEMRPDEKHAVSHRARAIRKLGKGLRASA